MVETVTYDKMRELRDAKMKGRYGGKKAKYYTEAYKKERAMKRGKLRKKRSDVYDQKTLQSFGKVEKK